MNKIQLKGIEEIIYHETLSNGLNVYLLPNTNVKNFYITFNTHFGSMHTEFKCGNDKSYTKVPNGIAHYLEHLMFNMPDGSAFDYFSKLGSSVNAYTSYDITCYEVYASKHFKENLNYLLDYVQTPYWNKEMVNNERGIITEEIKMYDNNPNTQLIWKSFENMLVKDKRKNLISGTVEDIKKITVNDLDACYNAFYHPANMFVVITGNFNPEEALAIISENQANKEFKEYIRPQIKKVTEPKNVKEEKMVKEMNVEINKVNIGIKVPLKNLISTKIPISRLRTYIYLITKVKFGASSLLKERLVNGGIILNGIGVRTTYTDDYILLNIITETEYPERFIDIINEELKHIRITKEELSRKSKTFISNYILHFDDIDAVNSDIQSDIIEFNEINNNMLEVYEELNILELNKLLNILKLNISSTLTIKPLKNKD